MSCISSFALAFLAESIEMRDDGHAHARQNADDGDDDEQFDEGEALPAGGVRVVKWFS